VTPAIVLQLTDLKIAYGRFIAVERLSLTVHAGEILGLLGPNGCGKSSSLKAIAGVLEPQGGVIQVAGVDRHARHEYRRQVGLVPQDLGLYEELTVLDNLRFFAGLYGLSGRERRARVSETLELVRLTAQARQRVGVLSGGFQRRLNLACALLHRPPLLLLDEPTVGLDLPSRDAIFDLLRGLRERGHGLVFTTHQFAEAETICDRAAILQHGRLAAIGTLAELAEEADVVPGGGSPSAAPFPASARLEHVYRRLTSVAA
jgi:ABC-2 type transport system ATP-binding protein